MWLNRFRQPLLILSLPNDEIPSSADNRFVLACYLFLFRLLRHIIEGPAVSGFVSHGDPTLDRADTDSREWAFNGRFADFTAANSSINSSVAGTRF